MNSETGEIKPYAHSGGSEMTRTEWENRFSNRMKSRSDVVSDFVVRSELESWPKNEEEWKHTLPEEAADEQMAEWID